MILARVIFICTGQDALRESLRAANLVGFVINGAVLPRESGNSDKPMSVSQVSDMCLFRVQHR